MILCKIGGVFVTIVKKSCISRLLAVLISVVLVIPLFVFAAEVSAQEAGGAIYYVSPTGNDSADGSKNAPFATLAKAFTAISGSNGGTIVLMGKIEPDNEKVWSSSVASLSAHTNLLVITGKDPVSGTVYEDAALSYNGTGLRGPTKIEYIRMEPCRTSCFINTCGYPFIVGEKVTANQNTFVIHDGIGETKKGTVSSTNTTVDGGDIRVIYLGGGYPTNTSYGVEGDCEFTINGGNVSQVTIGFDKFSDSHTTGKIGGNIIINVNGGELGTVWTSTNLDPEGIGGFAAIIFNNGTLTAYSLPEAAEGQFVIRSSYHGKVTATDTAGLFNYEASTGYDCYVDGEKVEGGSFTVEPGTHFVRFQREEMVDISMLESAYIEGFPDGSFHPDENLTRAQATELILKATTHKDDVAGRFETAYSDVSKSDWYYDSIAYFDYLDIFPDAWENKFLPNESITRGEFVYLASALLERYPNSMKLMEFSDVTSDNPYYTSIMNASRAGVVSGYGNGQFCPEADITRAEAVTVINRYLSRVATAGSEPIFSDIEGHWAKDQIVAASTSADDGRWVYDDTESGVSFKLPESADSAEDYVKALYSQSEYLSGQAIRDGVDVISEKMKDDILSTPNTLEIYGDKVTGTAYYIDSEKGIDNKYRKGTEQQPFKTYAGLISYKTLAAGDAVLFKRGMVHRLAISTVSGVIYGSYGEGDKPLLVQSKKNYARDSVTGMYLWEETAWKNVYKCTEKLTNVGVIGYDHDLFDYSEDSYNELYGDIYNMNSHGFTGPGDMNKDLAFYSVISDDVALYKAFNPDATEEIAVGDLYVYSEQGNPGRRFSSIEIGEKIDIFDGSPSNVIIDNLAMKFTGGHAVGFGSCKEITVTNCVFSWLGGSALSAATSEKAVTNYGNAVEIYGSCNGYYVENNWMYQIYDTGVTHQYSDGTVNIAQENVHYTGNLIEYVHWGIEFYNAQAENENESNDAKDYTRDIYDYYNVCRMGGYGWGSKTRFRQKSARLYCGAALSLNYDQFTEYNIFDRCAGYLINLPANSTEFDNKNIYIQDVGCTLGFLKGKTVTCSYDAYTEIKENLGDENAVVVIIEEEII